MRAGIELFGATECKAAFVKLDALVRTQYIAAALHAGVEYMAGLIESKTPVLSGKLRSAERITPFDRAQGRITEDIVVDKSAPYWKFVEFGFTATGRTPIGQIKPASRGKLRKVPGKHFISKTFRNRRTTARQVIRDTFRDLMAGFRP